MLFGNLSINPVFLVALQKGGNSKAGNYLIDAILTKDGQEGYHSSCCPTVCFYGSDYKTADEAKAARDELFDRCNAEFDKLAASSQLLNQWQPIETAQNKKGTVLILSKNRSIEECFRVGDFWQGVNSGFNYYDATHWMPVPKIPRESEK